MSMASLKKFPLKIKSRRIINDCTLRKQYIHHVNDTMLEPSLDINPDEAVAFGATINGAMLSGKMGQHDLILQDVTPLTLSTHVLGGIAHPMIPRNSPIPKRVSTIFSTTEDDQTVVTIRICEGERPMFQDNHFLGLFHLTGIAPAPRGVTLIETTFEVDANGILKVSSEDKASGARNEIVINNNDNYLSTVDIDRMINDAEKFAEADKKRVEAAQARNRLESFLYLVKKMLKDEDTSLSKYTRKGITEAVEEVMNWLDANSGADAEDCNEKMEELKAFLAGVNYVHKIKDEF